MNLQPIASNMTEVETDRYKILFSYSTPVSFYDKVLYQWFKSQTHFSVTTTKHVNKWLKLNKVNVKEVIPVEHEVLDKLEVK